MNITISHCSSEWALSNGDGSQPPNCSVGGMGKEREEDSDLLCLPSWVRSCSGVTNLGWLWGAGTAAGDKHRLHTLLFSVLQRQRKAFPPHLQSPFPYSACSLCVPPCCPTFIQLHIISMHPLYILFFHLFSNECVLVSVTQNGRETGTAMNADFSFPLTNKQNYRCTQPRTCINSS